MSTHTRISPCHRVLSLSIALACLCFGTSAIALDVTMGGTFMMSEYAGDPGEDLLSILGHENEWVMNLYDVEYDCFESPCGYPYIDTYMTSILLAADFDFEFAGPDAALLNEVVASQFESGGPDGAYLEVVGYNPDCIDIIGFVAFVHLFPSDYSEGISMEVTFDYTEEIIPLDEQGCPIIGPFETVSQGTTLFDTRGSNDGNIYCVDPRVIWLTDLPTNVPEGMPTPGTWSDLRVMY